MITKCTYFPHRRSDSARGARHPAEQDTNGPQVRLPGGLIVPVVHDIQQNKTISNIVLNNDRFKLYLSSILYKLTPVNEENCLFPYQAA